MPMYFPPKVIYPLSMDSDYTLFKVYNTSETITVANTDSYAEEIPIRPQPADKPEIWPENGYATISGELFYYDAVDKNSNDRICRFRRCVRDLGGKSTQFNSENTWVRGFVVADHHTQLADCTLLIENFVGENFSEDFKTLDWRIRHLADTPIISDDFGCADVEFDFNIVSTSPATGTVANYSIQSQGGVGDFTLQFGDGNFTNSSLFGTHIYAPGANIDPVVIIKSNTCEIVQTSNIRTNTNTPVQTPETPPFIVPVPIPPPIPPFNVPNINAPTPQMNFPPITMPPFPAFPGFPSIIEISQIGGVSVIEVTPIVNFHPDIHICTIGGRNGGGFPSVIPIGPFPSMIPIGPFPPVPPIEIKIPIIPPIEIAPAKFPSIVVDIEGGGGGMGGGMGGMGGGMSGISSIGGGRMSLVGGEMIELEHPEIQSQSLNKVEIGEDIIMRIANGVGRTFAEVLSEQLKSMIIEPSNFQRSVMPLTMPQEIPNFDMGPEVTPLEVIPVNRRDIEEEEEEVELSPVQIMRAKKLGQETDSIKVRVVPKR